MLDWHPRKGPTENRERNENMSNETKMGWISDLKALANKNYSKGYGWQVLVECWGQSEWLYLVEDCTSYAKAKAKVKRLVETHQDRFDDAQAEIF
jgi:hypothetical protein